MTKLDSNKAFLKESKCHNTSRFNISSWQENFLRSSSWTFFVFLVSRRAVQECFDGRQQACQGRRKRRCRSFFRSRPGGDGRWREQSPPGQFGPGQRGDRTVAQNGRQAERRTPRYGAFSVTFGRVEKGRVRKFEFGDFMWKLNLFGRSWTNLDLSYSINGSELDQFLKISRKLELEKFCLS